MKEAYKKSVKDLFKELNSNKNGLDNKEVKKRLDNYGKNKLKEAENFGNLKLFFSQFNSFLIYILLFAGLISILLGHVIDSIVILVVIFVNAIVGFIQDFNAEKALENLKKLIVSKSRVVRDGEEIEILSEEIVVGDILILEAGDKIPADSRIIECDEAQTIESALTGESLPIDKNEKIILKNVSLANQKNMLFQGTSLVRGSAKALVVNTGMNTIFGDVALKLENIKRAKTPIQKKLDRFSKQFGFFILGIVILIAGLGFSKKFDLAEMFLTSVALAVSAIPEGLPAILTVSFAISARLMSKKNVIVRKLPAVEALGSVTVICTDKTGTLTEEKMSVEKVWAEKKENKNWILKICALCNNAKYNKEGKEAVYFGDPTETALVDYCLKNKIDKKELIEKNPSIKKLEFDSDRKMMSIIRENNKKYTMYTKGAISKILEKSSYELVGGKIVSMTLKRKKEIIVESQNFESKALRVLGFAYKELGKIKNFKEENLIFAGFVGMIDPPRAEIKETIRRAKKAGIKIKIITGDSALTAKAIGEKIGITGRVVEEKELDLMSDEDLKEVIEEIHIFARATPKQKLRVTKILQEMGETVAITGDGVNDVLALKASDIGIAMGIRGTDVARSVADVVLVDDNFSSIVEGVNYGRIVYDNIKKTVKYLLGINFSETILILVSLFFNFPLPLIALQILWLNLVSDTFPALSLVNEKSESTLNSKPRDEKSIFTGIWGFILISGFIAFAAEFIVFMISMNKGHAIELTRTLVLTTGSMFQIFFIYALKSDKSLFKTGIMNNKWMNYGVIASIIMHFVLLYTSLGSAFQVVPLTLNNWLFILPYIFSGLVIFEGYKLVRNYFK